MPLTINHQTIDKLSGPVTLTILKPKETYFRDLKKNDIYAPIFILFGDHHRSLSRSCKSCDNNCYKIYDKQFLKLIDSLAEPDYPVDFFIEGSGDIINLLPSDIKEKYNSLIPRLRENIAACYNRKLRGTTQYEEECPTKNIRWHFGDARWWLSNKKYNFEAFIQMFLEDFAENINNVDLNPKTFLFAVVSVAKKLSQYFPREDVIRYFSLIETTGLFTEEFSDIWLKGDNDIKSLIKKQLNKVLEQSEPELNKKFKKKWYNWTMDYIHYYLYDNPKNDLQFEMFADFYAGLANVFLDVIETGGRNIADRMEMILELTNFCKQMKKDDVVEHWRFTTSIFLDLYTILRAFKKPDETAKNAVVTFGCFGAAHVMDMTHFLTKIMSAYDIVFSNSIRYIDNNRDPVRCVNIDEDINLDEMIEHYKHINV